MKTEEEKVKFSKTKCQYPFSDDDCAGAARAVVKYLFEGIWSENCVCLDHLGKLIREIDYGEEDAWVKDVYLLKKGRIWYDGYNPKAAEEAENKLRRVLEEDSDEE